MKKNILFALLLGIVMDNKSFAMSHHPTLLTLEAIEASLEDDLKNETNPIVLSHIQHLNTTKDSLLEGSHINNEISSNTLKKIISIVNRYICLTLISRITPENSKNILSKNHFLIATKAAYIFYLMNENYLFLEYSSLLFACTTYVEHSLVMNFFKSLDWEYHENKILPKYLYFAKVLTFYHNKPELQQEIMDTILALHTPHLYPPHPRMLEEKHLLIKTFTRHQTQITNDRVLLNLISIYNIYVQKNLIQQACNVMNHIIDQVITTNNASQRYFLGMASLIYIEATVGLNDPKSIYSYHHIAAIYTDRELSSSDLSIYLHEYFFGPKTPEELSS